MRPMGLMRLMSPMSSGRLLIGLIGPIRPISLIHPIVPIPRQPFFCCL